MRTEPHLSTLPALLAGVLAGTCAMEARGQGTMLFTGGADPVLTISRTVDLRNPLLREIRFDFAFATDELPRPNVFLDSVTATLQAANDPALSAAFLVIDASAAVWAPPEVGTVPLNPASIVREQIELADFARRFGMETAFRVTAPVPEALLGSTATFYFDLFDNGDAVASAAWLGEVVLVPEPGPVLIGLAGLLLFCSRKTRS